VYNQARWLGEAIESVRAQTFSDWELVVVDDGSTDDTRQVIQRHLDDRRIRCLAEPHRERSAARNTGIAASSGHFIAFLDGDDRWRPEKLQRQVAALDASPEAGLCYTIARFIDEDGRLLRARKPARACAGRLLPRLMRGNIVILASVMLRRACLENVGGFDETLSVYGCEDWDLWLRMARRYPVVAVDEELTLYRQHAGGTSPDQVLASALTVIDKAYRDPTMQLEAGITRSAARARHQWYRAADVASQGRRRAALPIAMRALRENAATAFSRPALGALAALTLPRAATRALRRLGAA
jgi:hypothetical protein